VTLTLADAYAPGQSAGTDFDVGMAHLWWSHVPRERHLEFLDQLASRLRAGASVLMIDQAYVKGKSPPAFRRDRSGNRYELRTLENGDVYQVLKNYPTVSELKASLACISDEIEVTCLTFFWSIRAKLRG
jgi:hypothetical protein